MKLYDPETNCDVSKILLLGKINNIVTHFWDRWKKEYFVVNLREHQKIKLSNKVQHLLNVTGHCHNTVKHIATMCMENWNY